MQQGLEHCPEAKAIREEVFMKEQGFQVEFDDTDREAWHMVLWQDGKALATARLYSQGEGVYAIGRVAVRKEGRGKQLGRAVMEAMEQKARQLGAKDIQLSAQVQARGFYEKLGYRAYGQEYLDEHCLHIAMEKTL